MQRAHSGERLQDHQVQCPLEEFESVFAHVVSPHKSIDEGATKKFVGRRLFFGLLQGRLGGGDS
jgi:hypothetical protein